MTLMNKTTRYEIKRYLKSVRHSIPGSFSAKQAFITMLKSQIDEYFEKNPQATIGNVIDYFGKPEVISNEFDVKNYKDEIKKYKVKLICIVALSIILLSLCVILKISLNEAVKEGHIIITTDY